MGVLSGVVHRNVSAASPILADRHRQQRPRCWRIALPGDRYSLNSGVGGWGVLDSGFMIGKARR